MDGGFFPDRLDLLSGEGSSEEKSAEEEALEFLLEVLGDGRIPSTDVKKEAKAAGIAERTLWTAKRARPGDLGR